MNHAEQFAERCWAALCCKLPNTFPLFKDRDKEFIGIIAGSYSAFTAALTQQKQRGTNIPPRLEEVQGYLKEIGYEIEAQAFLDFYEQNGWTVGKAKMKNWQAALRNWKRSGWGQKKSEAPARPQSASLGALQMELENVRNQLRSIINPGGSAWSKTASMMSPEELDKIRALEARKDGLRKRIDEFSK